MNARPWTPESRDALLARVTALTAGTAVVGAVGAVGLGAAFAVTTHPKVVTRKAASTTTATVNRPAAATNPTAVAPGKVQVQVLNGVGTPGAARAVADQLTAAGFNVVAIGNAPGTPVSASAIIYPASQAGAFRTLAAATGVNVAAATGTGSTLTLVIGPDWAGSLPAAQSQSNSATLAQPPAPPQNVGGGGVVVSSGGS